MIILFINCRTIRLITIQPWPADPENMCWAHCAEHHNTTLANSLKEPECFGRLRHITDIHEPFEDVTSAAQTKTISQHASTSA